MTTISDRLPVVTPVDRMLGPGQGHWTYEHYAALPDDGKRYEIINGVLYMTPSPGRSHQEVALEFAAYLRAHVKSAHLGRVYIAPFDVELTPKVVVQPDVMVILNENSDKVTSSRIVGAPDLVIEIASPSTSTYDRHKKNDAYAHAGVPEYWIVDPVAHTVEVLMLEGEEYQSLGVFQGKAFLPSKIVPEMNVHVEQFFM
jgi:Uma2 family endonuclease